MILFFHEPIFLADKPGEDKLEVQHLKIQQAASTKCFLFDAKILWNSEKHFSTKTSFIEPYIIKIPT